MYFKRQALALLLAVCLAMGLLPASAGAASTDKAIQILTTANPTGGIEGYNNAYHHVYYGTWNDEPVKWRVLDTKTNMLNAVKGDGLFLLTEKSLGPGDYDGVSFDSSYRYSIEWQDSQAQKLCKTFEQGHLTDSERAVVLATIKSDEAFTLSSSSVYSYDAADGILNGDKVFFLSAEEASNPDYGFTDNDSRKAIYGSMYTNWWLRSPVSDNGDVYAGMVDRDGIVEGGDVTMIRAARPALNLDLSAVLFTSAAEGGKPSGLGLSQVGDYGNKEWKLTLLDTARNFSVTQTKVEGTPGETLSLSYLDAQTGENEYVSAMIVDGSDVLYYGRLAQSTASAGEARFTIPADLSAGSYTLKVFSEQCNGDKKTDYASAFMDIPLTVEPNTYTAKLHAANLTGAAAALDKTSGIEASDTVTVTITPEAGKAFDTPPAVTATGATVGTVTAGANGTYICPITGFIADATIYVNGSATAPIVPNLPQTGDNSHIALWGAMLTASMLGMYMILRRRGAKTE